MRCIHSIEGRIRINVPGVKSSAEMAACVERFLLRYEGVLRVKGNPHTGNVLVHYDPQAMSPGILGKLLREQGYFSGPHRHAGGSRTSRTNLGARVAENVLLTATEIALRSLIGALV